MNRFLTFLLIIITFSSYAQSPEGVSNKQWKNFLEAGAERKLDCKKININELVKEAEKFLGVKHVMGGYSKKGIDCSGLVKFSFEKIGCTIEGRTAQDLAYYGRLQFNGYELKKGDLVFFTGTYRTNNLISHAGIVIGEGEFIHVSASKGVMKSNFLNGYWSDHFIFGTVVSH